jgi:hypothetical protein
MKSVSLPVVPEVVLAPERLAADVARVGPLVRVSALMDQQVVRLGELPAAELADELLLGARGRCGPGARAPTAPSTSCPCGSLCDDGRRPGFLQTRPIAPRRGLAVQPQQRRVANGLWWQAWNHGAAERSER